MSTDQAPTTPTARKTTPSAVRTLLRLWPYVRPVRVRLATAAVVAIVASCVGLVIPLVLKWLVDGPVAGRDPGGVWLGALFVLLLGVAEALLFGFRRWLVARPLAGVEAAMRADLYHRLQRLPVAFHDRWASGQLLSRATGDLTMLRLFLAFPLTFLLVNGVTILVGMVVLLAQEWTLGLVLLAPVVPLVVVCSLFEGRYAAIARRAQDQVGDLTTVVEEGVLGIRVIKGFGRHRAQARAFRELSGTLRGTELRKAELLATIWAVIVVLPELAIGAALVLGVLQVAGGALSAGTLVAFLSTALALRWPVESIGFLLAMSQEAATATRRYFEVLDVEPESEGPESVSDSEPEVSGRAHTKGAPGPEDGLLLSSVTFRYPDAPPGSPPVLDGVDLHVRSGETLALVGATGSGKTTLTALVPRLHEVTSGRITLDGVDITELPREELRTLVSVAFEEPTLFSASVGENVLMGAEPGAGQRELDRALDIAQADFAHRLPHGTDTQVGEQGLSLSGGQRQRLALARAVVGRPRFLVLDDPLSALDVHTEALVEAALRRVLADTTALVVAHRPSTVLLADRVALLSGGRIAAVGTHHRLLRENAEYAWLMSGETTAHATSHQHTRQATSQQHTRQATSHQHTRQATSQQHTRQATSRQRTRQATSREQAPEAACQEQAPEVTSWERTPEAACREQAQEATSRERTPEATSRGHAPEATSREPTPKATRQQRTAQAASREHAPKSTGRDHTPEAACRGHAPEATSREHTPEATSQQRTPQTTSQERTPKSTSRDHTPEATSGRDHTPEATSGRDHTPKATSGRSHTTEATSQEHTPKATSGRDHTPDPPTPEHTKNRPHTERPMHPDHAAAPEGDR